MTWYRHLDEPVWCDRCGMIVDSDPRAKEAHLAWHNRTDHPQDRSS
jgi:hypothetical protein